MPTQPELVAATQPRRPDRVARALPGVTLAVVAALAVAVSATSWPLFVLPGAAGLLLVVGAVVRLDLALMLLTAAVPLEYSVALGNNSQLTLVKLAGGLCFISFVVQLAMRRRRLRLDATHLMLLGILVCLLVSLVAAQSLDTALPVTLRYVSYVGLFIVLTAFTGDYRTLERVVWVLSLACSVAGVLAIRNLLIGFATRATPTYGDANDLAYILSATLPLTLWLLRYHGVRRLLVVLMVALISLADVLTFSRGAAVGLACAALWLGIAHRNLIRVALVPVLLVGCLVATVAVAQPARLSTALTDKTAVAGANVSHRLDSWRSAVELVVTHPFVGVGPGNFQYYNASVDGRPPTDQDPTVVHDTYLDIGVELGLPALALVVAYLLTCLRRLHVLTREGVGPTSFALAATAAMIVAVTSALTLSEQYYAPLWLIGALATAMWLDLKTRSARGQLNAGT